MQNKKVQNDEEGIPFKEGTLSNGKEFKMKQKLYLSVSSVLEDSKYEEYCIETTHGEIMGGLERNKNLSKEEIDSAIISCLLQLLKYSMEELHQLYLAKNEDWIDWCCDCVILGILRYLKNETPIQLSPIRPNTKD
tara:strand:- start:613 stop:1020 length:408 start_codon:yes stop_codon:yes gene_type:complete